MRCSTQPWKVRENRLPPFTSNPVPIPQRYITHKMCSQFVPQAATPDVCSCNFHRLSHSKESRQQRQAPERTRFGMQIAAEVIHSNGNVAERTKFTREQVNEMRDFAGKELHWSTKTRDQPELSAKVDRFCRRIDVVVPRFKSWVLNNKRKYQESWPSAPPPVLDSMPEEHKPRSSAARPPLRQPKLEEF